MGSRGGRGQIIFLNGTSSSGKSSDVIADHVLSEPWRLRDCLEVMAGYRVVFVGVRCSAAELERREHRRGDRPPGVALAQQAQVHAHGLYDVECDTTTASPSECAGRITD